MIFDPDLSLRPSVGRLPIHIYLDVPIHTGRRGRPRTIRDMRAYKAQKERERRERQRAEKAGK